MPDQIHDCAECGAVVNAEVKLYQYEESGLPNVYLQGVRVAQCQNCGNVDVIIPYPRKIHRAIALALANSPFRLAGPQVRFLRKRTQLNQQQFAAHVSATELRVQEWESSTAAIDPVTDRLTRMLAAVMDPDLAPAALSIAGHLPTIVDQSADDLVLHVDVVSLSTSFIMVRRAA